MNLNKLLRNAKKIAGINIAKTVIIYNIFKRIRLICGQRYKKINQKTAKG